MIDEIALQEILNMMKDYASTIHNAVSALEGVLNTLTTSTPELPDKPGFYLTQQHTALRRHHDGEWEMFDNSGLLRRVYWKGQGLCSELGPDAFPLVPLSEVILPSEHIKEEEED